MIRVLDSFVADKIAAGEVIEKPLSIVKELVENSIDAGAKSIVIEIRNGGKSYIRVTDDGSGIPSDEVETAFLRHATGKLVSVDDLNHLTTLGFRGEALASISAISRMTVVTRTSDEPAGTRLVLHGGKVQTRERAGANPGTTMIVEDVFYNTPARRKFMGSDSREASVIIELVQKLAVFYSDIRFMMISSGRTVLSTDGSGDCARAIRAVYPEREFSNLIEIGNDTVKGYVSPPGVTKSNRKGQIFFVNGRIVSSKTIEKGLEKGYKGRIFSGYPVAVLFVNIAPDTVDVNIHPGKKEIKFLDDEVVIDAVSDAVSRAMDQKQSISELTSAGHSPVSDALSRRMEEPKEQASHENAYAASAPVGNQQPETTEYEITEHNPDTLSEPVSIEEYIKSGSFHSDDNSPAEKSVIISKSESRPFEFKDLVYRGSVFNSYVIMEDSESMYLIDQHAAHERIFYEKLVHQYNSENHLMQPLLAPFVVQVSPSVYNMERGWMNDVARMGYDIEDFGDNTFVIRGIPSFMSMSEADSFIRTYMDNISDIKQSNPIIDKLIVRSCKSAVKANNRLSEHEIMALIRELSECENPFCCPHGRPTFIKITKYEIERTFRRV